MKISYSHLFNKLEIHTTFMYTYIFPSISSYSLSDSLAHSRNYAHLRNTQTTELDLEQRNIELVKDFIESFSSTADKLSRLDETVKRVNETCVEMQKKLETSEKKRERSPRSRSR